MAMRLGRNTVVYAFAWISTSLLFAKFLVFYELHGPPTIDQINFDAPSIPRMDALLHPSASASVSVSAASSLSAASAGAGAPKNADNKFNYSDYTGPSTVYQKFIHPFPCYRGEKTLMVTTPAHEGILFQRPHKVGSTTLTGVVLRLAHTRGRKQGFDKCKHRTNHGTAREYDYFNRDKTKSILFSLIRHPESRSMSRIFHFDISVHQAEPTAPYIKSNLLAGVHHMAYLRDLGTRNYTGRRLMKDEIRPHVERQIGLPPNKDGREWMRNEATPEERRRHHRLWEKTSLFGPNVTTHDIIRDILEDYNFIAILERFNESLVVMQMLFGLTTKEILYTRSRSAGGYSNGLKDRPCIYLIPRFDPPAIKEFLKSDEWNEIIQEDLELYKAAHKSLDRTIDALGREEFNKKLAYFEESLKKANEHCKGRVRTMCTEDGQPIPPKNRTCYIWGEGCDYDCINDLDL